MAKAKTAFVCNDCGADFPKWQGQCGEWHLVRVVFGKSTDPHYADGRRLILVVIITTTTGISTHYSRDAHGPTNSPV